MKALISVFQRTIVPAAVLILLISSAQSQTPTTLSISPAKVILPAVKSTNNFQVVSNTSWKDSTSQSWLTVNKDSGSGSGTIFFTAQQNTDSSARIGTITVSAKGVDSRIIAITQVGTKGYALPPIPLYSSLASDTLLPDPFTFLDGSRMTTMDLWPSRRAEIALLAQEFEYGYKQKTPYSATAGSFSNNSLTVTVTDSGKTISFSCSISYPSTGTAPYPAMIACGVSSLNSAELSNNGVAVITFPSDQIAQENDLTSRGVGKFYDMYGSNHSAGALMAWAWGMDRLIDAIEKTPAANIDPKRLGVTGCSRWGKGALACGAFDERLVLTIPEESGSGGAASWRVSDYDYAHGLVVQTLQEIVNENVWFAQNFSQFRFTSVKLPYDQHSIIGLVAPRACLIIENDILWLGPHSTWNSANAAHAVWEGLNLPEKMGYTESVAHNHCSFPSYEQSTVNAFVQKFLVGNGTSGTTVMSSDPGYSYDQSQWLDWFPPDPSITSVREQGQQSLPPKGFYLEQNYPNPFNPATVINYQTSQDGHVTLMIYDALGRVVRTLVDEYKPSGRYSAEFEASGLSTGIYYYSLKAGDFKSVKKMTLIK